MHLLKVDASGEIRIVENFHDNNTPPYAILSHTWGPQDDEVTFSEIKHNPSKIEDKAGYRKIRYCAQQAGKDGLEYFWVDTCCINKENLSELSESITLMFSWYQKAAKCYAYLCDVSDSKRDDQGSPRNSWKVSFRQCKWFTRGWTLQEMLAPASVEFFSREWEFLGDKISLALMIRDITAIPVDALLGATPLSEFSPKSKIQWASSRRTTKVEDEVYCMLGIFGIHLLPHYGEREYAWVRFKQEVGRNYETQVERIAPAPSKPPSNGGVVVRGSVGVHHVGIGIDLWHIQLEKLIESLGFNQMDSRRTTIKAAHSTTCQWLLRTQVYRDWLDVDSARNEKFLWLKGKPGVGKSTLVKHAHSQASASESGEITLAYFFNARGNALEKSTQGMYRSLLIQLLQSEKGLLSIFDKEKNGRLEPSEEYDSDWTIERLRELLTSAVGELKNRHIRCFIDALDECDVQEVRDMVLHFETLAEISESRRFHILFASRHYPIVRIFTTMELIVENETGHGEDMIRYVRDHLQIGREKRKVLEEVQTEIKAKARGVFMWAVLVVDILNQEFLNGRMFAVRKRLTEIPSELSELFKDMIQRDDTNKDDLLLCIQWIAFAGRPLNLREFYFAMVIGLHPDFNVDALTWRPDDVSEGDMRRFVVASSKGLAELTSSSSTSDGDPTVQFIHESVKDFMIRDGGLRQIWPKLNDEHGEVDGISHDRLRRCCQNYFKIDLEREMRQLEDLPAGRVVSETFYHAWYNNYEWTSDRYPYLESVNKKSKQIHGKFPFLDYATNHLFYHTEKAATCADREDLSDWSLKNWTTALPHWHHTKDDLHLVEDMSLSQQLNRALHIVAGKGYQEVAKMLVTRGADVDAQTHPFGNALLLTSWNGQLDMVKLLLDNGANIDARGGYFGNALYAAAHSGHESVVKLLLDRGADVNARGIYFTNALYTAADQRHRGIVKRLLDRGAKVNTSSDDFQMLLRIVSQRKDTSMTKLLLTIRSWQTVDQILFEQDSKC